MSADPDYVAVMNPLPTDPCPFCGVVGQRSVQFLPLPDTREEWHACAACGQLWFIAARRTEESHEAR